MDNIYINTFIIKVINIFIAVSYREIKQEQQKEMKKYSIVKIYLNV